MRHFHVIFITLVMFFLGSSSAFAGPKFIIEEIDGAYVMYLQMDDVSNVVKILVEGEFVKDGRITTREVELNASTIATLNKDEMEIHKLSSEFDGATYLVKIFNKQGSILEYPLVEIALSDPGFALAMNN